MPILGSSISAANIDMMSKIWTNRDTIIWLFRKHCGKRRNCSLRAISSFSTMFPKYCWCVKMSIYGVKALSHIYLSSNNPWFRQILDFEIWEGVTDRRVLNCGKRRKRSYRKMLVSKFSYLFYNVPKAMLVLIVETRNLDWRDLRF